MRAEALDPVLLRTFVAVADLGSFTAAATAEGYTQSAVSRQIASLEDICGVELFVRGARGVRPTPAGEYLLPHARALLDRLADTARALDGLRRLDTGTLRLAGHVAGRVHLAALVQGDLSRHVQHRALGDVGGVGVGGVRRRGDGRGIAERDAHLCGSPSGVGECGEAVTGEPGGEPELRFMSWRDRR